MAESINVSPKKPSFIRTLVLAAVIIFVMVLASQTIGFSRSGFDTEGIRQQFFFYVEIGIAFLVGILIIYTIELAIKEGDSKYGDSLSFNSPGEVPGIKTNFFTSTYRLVLLSLIIFGAIGAYNAYTHQSFTGVGVLEQQFTAVDSILFSSFLIPAPENLGAAFAWAFALLIWRSVARKKNIDATSFIVIAIVLAIVIFLVFGYTNHLLRYGASDIDILRVILFWGMGGLITVLTGSFIPFWIAHISNNLFYDLTRNFANDTVAIVTFSIVILLVILFMFTFRKK